MYAYRVLLISLVMLCLPACWSRKEYQAPIYVINVLDSEYYNDCHIPQSINVSLDQVESFAQSMPYDAEIIIYCSNFLCTASHYVAKLLMAMGFRNVQVYEGGIAEWYQKGFPVVGDCKMTYLQEVVEPSGEPDMVPVISAEELAHKLEISIPSNG
jgi:rhodanese-related sulfurtransferase